MTERLIHPEDYRDGDTTLIAFVRANGLHEADIAAAFPLVVEGGRLTVTEFVFPDPPLEGRRTPELAPGGDSFLKRSKTVPLISPPEDHGL